MDPESPSHLLTTSVHKALTAPTELMTDLKEKWGLGAYEAHYSTNLYKFFDLILFEITCCPLGLIVSQSKFRALVTAAYLKKDQIKKPLYIDIITCLIGA